MSISFKDTTTIHNTAQQLSMGVKTISYVTATEVDSVFYPPWDGKMSMSFRAE